MDNQQGPTVQNKELCSMLSGSVEGRGVWGRMDICICMAESLCYPPETHNVLGGTWSCEIRPCELLGGQWDYAMKTYLPVTCPGHSEAEEQGATAFCHHFQSPPCAFLLLHCRHPTLSEAQSRWKSNCSNLKHPRRSSPLSWSLTGRK